MSANNEVTKSICQQFKDACKDKHPQINEFVGQVPESERESLSAALVPIDIAARIERGEQPKLDDYSALGVKAFQCATQILKLPGAGLPNDTGGWQLKSNVPVSGQLSAILLDDSLDGDTSPGTIGPYHLLSRIGKGGMGTVWLAQQTAPVRRRVAVKLIRTDARNAGAIARFEAERQAIAMMDHQNIAKILDAGTTETGIPFFVMEYVDGVRLDRYCDDNRLTIAQRLELMLPVCRAVQHAHYKGIIHRDIKPSNIVVADYDGQPIAKVIDFGLAKAFESDQRLTDEASLTRVGEVVGTLQYLSPEQATGKEVDTRSDIYSLGVTIYKLLTGTTPIQTNAASDQSLVAVLEDIRQHDPPRPSQRLVADSGSIRSISDLRKTRPERLRQVLQGDIDWIVMKTLEKDRNRRYETANDLALDIERYLNDDEVLARPPTRIYRIQKFVKRNRGLVASLLTIAVLLVAGIIGTGVGLIMAIDQAGIATKAAEESRQHEKEARQSEWQTTQLQLAAEARLYSVQMKSAWSDWLLGNVESAWRLMQDAGECGQGWEARFLRAQFTASKETLYGHAMRAVDVEVSPDEKYLATAGSDHRVLIWSADTRKFIYKKQLTGAVIRIRFSPDSKMIVATDRDNRITLWDVASGETIRVFGPFEKDIYCADFLGDQGVLIAGECHEDMYRDGAARRTRNEGRPDIIFLAIDDGTELNRIGGHEKTITQVESADNGNTIISCSEDTTVRIFRKDDSGNWTATILQGHTMEVTGLDISPSGQELATSGADKTVMLWDLQTNKLIRAFVGHTNYVTDVAFSSDGQYLVSSSFDCSARIWQRDGTEVGVRRGHFGFVYSAVFLPDDLQIATVSGDQTIQIWDVANTGPLIRLKPHSDIVWQSDLSADGKTIFSGCEDGTISRINKVKGTVESMLNNGCSVLALACSPDDDIFVTGDEHSEVKVWSGSSGTVLKTFAEHSGMIWDVQFSPDGDRLLTASDDTTVKIWNTRTWQVIGTLSAHDSGLSSARFSPDSRHIVTCGADGSVRLWDAKTQDCIHVFPGHEHCVWRAVFSPDSQYIASSAYDGEVRIWSVAERCCVHTIDAHTDQVAGLAYTADGSRIITGSDDGTGRIFDAKTGLELFVFRDDDGAMIVHASLSKDGRTLITGSATGCVTLRTAAEPAPFEPIFLPQTVIEICRSARPRIIWPDADKTELEEQLQLATRCCRTFTTYRSWTIRGICEYRLGRFDEAVTSLKEAQHLEPIEYGEPDERPDIEAFLALAYCKTGQPKLANATRAIFDAKVIAGSWTGETFIVQLITELDQAFAELRK